MIFIRLGIGADFNVSFFVYSIITLPKIFSPLEAEGGLRE